MSFPRLHFFLIAHAPIAAASSSEKSVMNVKELISQANSERNFYSNVKTSDGKTLAVSLIFRGKIATQDVDKQLDDLQTKNADDFVEWIPNNIKVSNT